MHGFQANQGFIPSSSAAAHDPFAAKTSIVYNTGMSEPRVVLDTNVLIAALRSKRGASSRLVSLLGIGRFEITVSVALVLEYEDVLMRQRTQLGLTQQDIEDFIDSICALARLQQVYYQWRPSLRDEGDELVLDLAVAAGCDHIVTFNRRDFVGAERFGLQVMTPREFLVEIGEIS
jgi:putative PIN family toxin of toxin-antitoxin system